MQQALVSCRADGDCGQEARALSRLGMIAWRQGDYAGAEKVYEEALGVIGEDESMRREEADVRYGLGLVYRQQQDYKQAQQQFQREITLNQKLLDRQREARTLSALGGIAFSLKQFEAALNFCNSSIEIRNAIGDLSGVGATLLNIAQIHYRSGDYYQTEQFLKQALTIHQNTRGSWWLASTLNQFGILYTLIGESGKAIEYLQNGRQVAQSIGSKDMELKILCNMSIALQSLDTFVQAQHVLDQGLQIAKSVHLDYAEAMLLEEQAKIMLHLSEPKKAIELANNSLIALEESGTDSAAAPNLITLAMSYHKLGERSTALAYVQRALSILNYAVQSDYTHHELYTCSRILVASGEHALAQSTLKSAHAVLISKANRISSMPMRNSFFTNVTLNRRILEAFQELHSRTLH